MIQVEKTHLEGCVLVKMENYYDHRGYFQEMYHSETFANLGLPSTFMQDNLSFTVKNAVRGLHLQRSLPQGKMVRCLKGKIIDVVVDLNFHSKSFKQFGMFELRESTNAFLYVPPGFAHGFYAVEDSLVLYKCTTHYDRESDGGVLWNDAELGIPWPQKCPILSEKDSKLPTLKEYLKG
jgi:dTDP-4-dehydrorhamnose 3,5-epimerase